MKAQLLLLQLITPQPGHMESFLLIIPELTDHFVLIIFYYIYDE